MPINGCNLGSRTVSSMQIECVAVPVEQIEDWSSSHGASSSAIEVNPLASTSLPTCAYYGFSG